jgi:NAD(P)H-hydrate epimerase
MERQSFPTVDGERIGWITERDMVEVDRIMIDDLHIELLQMMENAGRNLARLVLDLAAPRSVVVAAGSGGNGGGGLVAARHLTNAGVDVTVTMSRPPHQLTGVTAHQHDILQRMGVAMSTQLSDADVTIDAVIGYSLRGAPRGASAALVKALSSAPFVVALDTPSGLDVTTGEAPGVAVSATATMTLALPKIGLRTAPQVGDLYLADISVPASVAAAFGPTAPDFSPGSILAVV